MAVLRDSTGRRFYDPVHYETAVSTVMAALQLVSAAYSPLKMDFTSYRTPFALLSEAQIRSDARPENNPFHDYFTGALCDRLISAGVELVGISMAFPGQIQPGYSLAYAIKARLPKAHITVGGPAITQLMARFDDARIAGMRGPFDSVVLFEGEAALLDLVDMLACGRTPPPVIRGARGSDLAGFSPPDFDGLPLEKYFSPEVVLPYDPTRGCYWGKCAFCHYGLSCRGTAAYRQRPVAEVAAHLKTISDRWGCRIVYFSQDAFAPAFAEKVAVAPAGCPGGHSLGTDMRPEPALTPACCRKLKAGGALSVALGIESAAPPADPSDRKRGWPGRHDRRSPTPGCGRYCRGGHVLHRLSHRDPSGGPGHAGLAPEAAAGYRAVHLRPLRDEFRVARGRRTGEVRGRGRPGTWRAITGRPEFFTTNIGPPRPSVIAKRSTGRWIRSRLGGGCTTTPGQAPCPRPTPCCITPRWAPMYSNV